MTREYIYVYIFWMSAVNQEELREFCKNVGVSPLSVRLLGESLILYHILNSINSVLYHCKSTELVDFVCASAGCVSS